jgi:hypothetical protein
LVIEAGRLGAGEARKKSGERRNQHRYGRSKEEKSHLNLPSLSLARLYPVIT